MDAIDNKRKNVILTLSGKIGVCIKPLFPGVIEHFARLKAGGEVKAKM